MDHKFMTVEGAVVLISAHYIYVVSNNLLETFNLFENIQLKTEA